MTEQAATDNLQGLIPESWCCIDCGTNTAPGLSSRVELEAAFAADKNDNGINQQINAESEVYTVRERVWAAAGASALLKSGWAVA